MFRSHVILIAMVALASVASGLAQNGEISISSKVSPEQIKEWLQSSYPIQVAWGAYFASKSDDAVNDDVYVTIMSRRLARWVPPRDNQYSDGSFRISRAAISEILYALIEKNETVPAASLTPITLEFPAESLILAARLPAEESAPMLEDWYNKKPEPADASLRSFLERRSAVFAGVAAMLLAKDPPPGFAAAVLAESGENLSFWVADGMWQQSQWKGDGGVLHCHDADQELTPSALLQQEQAWPPLFTYLLQNAGSPYSGTLLVEAGGERISYRRVSAWTRPTPCYQPALPSDKTWHHVLAEMLHVDDKDIPWPAYQDVISIPGNKEEFLRALTRQIDLEESKFRATVKALQEKGYLTESEANTVRPKLAVTVKDVSSIFHGQDHLPPPLPKWVSTDSRTSISYDKR